MNSSYSKLARGSYFLILDNFVNLGIGAIFWLILAKIAEPAILGQAMVVTSLATTVIGFSGYGIQLALSKYMSEYKAKNMLGTARQLLKAGIRGSLIISAALAIILSLLSGQISTVAYQNPSLALLLVFTISTFLPTQTIIAAILGAFQGLQIMKYVMITDLIFQVSRIAFAVFALLYGLQVFGILVGFSLASFISLVVCYFYLLPRAFPASTEQMNPIEGIKQIVRFTGLNYFSVGIKTLSSQLGILILGTQSFEWAAFYGLALLISKIVGSFSHSVGGALLPTASEEQVKGNKVQLATMVNTAVRLSILISGFGFIVLMIDPVYFLKLISDSYVEAAWALRILAISAIVTAISAILTSLLNASNRAADVARIGLVSSLSTIVLTFILAPIDGLEGAAIAMFVGSILSLALSLIVLKQKDEMIISSKSMVKPFIAIMSGLLVGYLFVLWNHVLLGIVVAISCYVTFSMAYKVTTKVEIKRLIGIIVNRK